MVMKWCPGCKTEKPLSAFVLNRTRDAWLRDLNHPRAYRRLCAVCENTKRDERKNADRVGEKCRTTLSTHAQKYGMKPREFSERFGWGIDIMRADMQAAIDAVECEACHKPFKLEDSRNLSDVTVDIIDPRLLPYWRVNTRVICRTCNTRKGRRSQLDVTVADHEREQALRAGRPRVGASLTVRTSSRVEPVAEPDRCPSRKFKVQRSGRRDSWRCQLAIGHDGDHRHKGQAPWPNEDEPPW